MNNPATDPVTNRDNGLFLRMLRRSWSVMPESMRLNLNDTFQPEDVESRQIPGEETELIIRLAWYRDLVGHIVFHHFYLILVLAILLAVGAGVWAYLNSHPYYYISLPILIWLALMIWGAVDRFEYFQWRLLKTNARLVISIPQHGAWPLVDNIELKGLPAILDTNWSPNPVWRVFQFFTGARDLYISMSGLQFVEGKAKVRDALIIPDIMPNDVFELKKLVFKPK